MKIVGIKVLSEEPNDKIIYVQIEDDKVDSLVQALNDVHDETESWDWSEDTDTLVIKEDELIQNTITAHGGTIINADIYVSV